MSTPDSQTDARRRSSVLSRIQDLLSPQQHGSLSFHDKELDISPRDNCRDTSPGQVKRLDSKFLKVRVVTWNMHDSLPKGDLEDLLGKIPHYDASSAKPGQFPRLANDPNHPFHLVVVAGQECPTPSGIPMGLGAGFKIDREKLKNGIRDDKVDADIFEERREEIRDNIAYEKMLSGWTQLVEDWLCNAIGSRAGSPSTVQIGTPKPLIRKKSCRDPRRGPYQLLIKDRLMGIYLAVYIHRDLKPLVQGVSRSSVTTGLIGGRIGNKGGVGISLQLDGTTFLFLNAHLAAHEGKVNHRLANLSKIKGSPTELDVDTFLAGDDARAVAEDLTDKFDFTFLFGDLNFRLDISRLHADWLISRQEYAQALEFDQLNAIMKKGAFIEGFREAPIDFPPTFKYDVSRPSRRRRRLRPGDQSPPVVGHAEMAEEDVDEATDHISLASSMTTLNSRAMSESGLVDGYLLAVPSNASIRKNFTSRPKWLTLLSPSFATSPKSKFQSFEPRQVDLLTPTTPNSTVSIPPQSAMTPKTSNSIKKHFLRPPPLVSANFNMSQSSMQDEAVEEERGVYDTSSKKRVPSWCDRILWKSTVPRPEQCDDFSSQSRRATRRVSQFFQSFRSPSPRTSSLGVLSGQIPPSRSGSPTIDQDFIQMNSPTRIDTPPNFKSIKLPGLRRANSPPTTAPLPSQVSPRRPIMGMDRPRSASDSIWRFLPAFLSPSNPEEYQPVHIRGDVVCLSYGTLDDKEMRRLDGRSDHRPVVGAHLHTYRVVLEFEMQGFNKYYPPDYDPSQGSLNKVRGKHALGDRARKLDKGILIARFELPFNIWCGTCNNHIGMGVRYNAEKKKVGNYFSTPIYSFRCKCHLCDGWFEIQTDPKNTRYVVVSGAKQKDEEWNPEENGGFAIHDPDKGAGESNDPLVALEKTTDAKRHMETVQKPRIESLQGVSKHYNADPYSHSLKVRKRFREEKKIELAKRQIDDAIKDRYGLPATLRLLEEDEKAVQEARSQWANARVAHVEQEAKRRKISSSHSPSTSTNAVDSLRARILQNTAKKSTTLRTFNS